MSLGTAVLQGNNKGQSWPKMRLLFIVLGICVVATLLYSNISYQHQPIENIHTIVFNKEPLTKAIVGQANSAAEVPSLHSTQNKTPDNTSATSSYLVVMQRPDWKLAGKLLDHLERLERAASSGNAQASYLLALNLRHCYSAPVDEDELDKKLAEVADFSDSDLATDQLLSRYDYCQGVGENKRKDFYRYLSEAAVNGFVPAQEVLGTVTQNFFMEINGFKNLEREAFLKRRDEFMQQKINLLEQAAKHGSVKALTRLSNMYHSQNHGANGQIKSFALNNLILEITQSNKLYNRYSWLVQRQYEQLSPEEIQTGLDMTSEWLEAIKVNGTLYPGD